MLNWTDFDFSFLASKTWFSRFTITIAQPDRSRLVCQLKFQHDFTFVACHAISRFVLLLPIIPSFHGPPGASWMSPRRATVRHGGLPDTCRCLNTPDQLCWLLDVTKLPLIQNHAPYWWTLTSWLILFFSNGRPWMPLKSSLVQSLPSKRSRLWVDFPLTNSTVQVLV